MRTFIWVVFAGALIVAPAAYAVLVQGGNGKADCYAGLDVTPDGTIVKTTPAAMIANACDGTCTFRVRACVGTGAPSKCTAQALSDLQITPALPEPATLGPENACGEEQVVTVTLGNKKKAKTIIKLIGLAAAGKPKKDKDNIKLICKKSTTSCNGSTTTTTLPPTCGATCANNVDAGPDELVLTIADSGTDLDNGWKGASHNFPLVPNGKLDMCLSNCDGTTDTLCDACGQVGPGSKNGEIFGAPLPLLASGTAVCVVSKWRQNIGGTTDVATGDTSLVVGLNSEVSLTDQNAICPQCRNGSCQGGASNGNPCTVEATLPVFISANRTDQYQLSSTCLPSSKVATLQIDFNPLTSGTSAPLTGDIPCPRAAGTPGVNPLKDDCGAGDAGSETAPGTPASRRPTTRRTPGRRSVSTPRVDSAKPAASTRRRSPVSPAMPTTRSPGPGTPTRRRRRVTRIRRPTRASSPRPSASRQPGRAPSIQSRDSRALAPSC